MGGSVGHSRCSGITIDWVAGMEQEDLKDKGKIGGIIYIHPMNPPLAQTLREWLWVSYPDRLAEKLREASKAQEELVVVAVLPMEAYSQSQPYSSQSSLGSDLSSVARRHVSRRVRPGLDEIEFFVEIASREERSDQCNAKRDRS